MATCSWSRLMRIIGLLAVFSLGIFLGPPVDAKMVQIDGKTYDLAMPGEFIPGEVIVQTQPLAMGTGPQAFQEAGKAIAAQVGGRVKATIPQHNLLLIKLAPLPQAMAAQPASQKAQLSSTMQTLQQSPLVKVAVPNYKQSIFPPLKRGLRPGPKMALRAAPLRGWQNPRP